MLQCKYIQWLESFHAEKTFNEQCGALIDLIEKTNATEGVYYNTDHLIKTGYLAYLACMDLTINQMGETDVALESGLDDELLLVTKAALLMDYCHQNEADDNINIAFTQSAVRKLAQAYNEILSIEDADMINVLIAHSFYDRKDPSELVAVEDNPQDTYAEILRDVDKLYAAVYFDRALFLRFYQDVGKKFYPVSKEFMERTKRYFHILGEQVATGFAKQVQKEVITELLNVCDEIEPTLL